MSKHEWVQLGYIVIALITMAVAIVPRVLNPELTETQLFAEYWVVYTAFGILVAGSIKVLSIIEKR